MELKQYIPFFNLLPRLDREVAPLKAFFIGLIFGAFGLSLFLRSFIDFIIPFSIMLGLDFVEVSAIPGLAPQELILTWCLTGLYGYFRAADSNLRLDQSKGDSFQVK